MSVKKVSSLKDFPLDAISVHLDELKDSGIEALHQLSVNLGWPHRENDLRFLLQQGQGYLARDDGGRAHAAAMCFPFGDDFATIGMVITSPRLQAKGGGAWLMQHVMEAMHDRALGLHTTRAAHRLYRSLGFEDEGTVCLRQGVAAHPPEVGLPAGAELRQILTSDSASIVALDSLATGTQRSPFLAALLARGHGTVLSRNGQAVAYAVARNAGRGVVIGPVIAGSDEDAMAVVQPLLAQNVGEFVRIDSAQQHAGFEQFLQLCGLPVRDTVTRMSLYRPWPFAAAPEAAVYGLAAHATG